MDIKNGKHCGSMLIMGMIPLADHMTKLQNFTKGENRDFSAFRFSLQLMLDQT